MTVNLGKRERCVMSYSTANEGKLRDDKKE